MFINIKLQEDMFANIKGYHLETNKERLSFIFANSIKRGDRTTIIVPNHQSIILPDDDCYQKQTGSNVRLKKEVQGSIYQQLIDSGCDVLINVHDHWFSKEGTLFSSVDDQDDLEQDKYIRTVLQPELNKQRGINSVEIKNVSLVFDQNTIAARITSSKKGKKFTPINRLDIAGRKLQFLALNNSDNYFKSEPQQVFNRQSSFIPANTQKVMGDLKIVLVGAGGLGSILAESLLRVGFKDLMIVDDDKVEEHNLNRLQSCGYKDIGKYKSSVLAKRLKSLFKGVKITSVLKSVASEAVLKRIGDADIIIGAVDNDVPRSLLNKLSVSYKIPYFDLGTVVDNRDKLDFKSRLFITLPGITSCMECSQFEVINNKEVTYAMSDKDMKNIYRNRGYFIDPVKNSPTPSVLPINMMASSMLLTELINYLVGIKPMATMITTSYLQGVIDRCDEANFDEKHHPHCHCCGQIMGMADEVEFLELNPIPTSKLLNSIRSI